MFTYLDPGVRNRLIRDEKLTRIDANGQRIDAALPPIPGARSISLLGPIPLPMQLSGAEYRAVWYAAVRHTELSKAQSLADSLREADNPQLFATLADSMAVNSVLLLGDASAWRDGSTANPLVRVHSSCLTGDVFGSQRCECGPQLHGAMERIAEEPAGGMIVYMSGHEGRGIGLWAKAATYLLQDGGEDTYQANRSLGLPDDSRDFKDAASLIRFFIGDNPFRLLTNNPKKLEDLHEMGVSKVTREKHVCGVGNDNRTYLSAKKAWGHKIDVGDID